MAEKAAQSARRRHERRHPPEYEAPIPIHATVLYAEAHARVQRVLADVTGPSGIAGPHELGQLFEAILIGLDEEARRQLVNAMEAFEAATNPDRLPGGEG
jgi:hypothetical protein